MSDILIRSPNKIFCFENGLLSVFEKRKTVNGLGYFTRISLESRQDHHGQIIMHFFYEQNVSWTEWKIFLPRFGLVSHILSIILLMFFQGHDR